MKNLRISLVLVLIVLYFTGCVSFDSYDLSGEIIVQPTNEPKHRFYPQTKKFGHSFRGKLVKDQFLREFWQELYWELEHSWFYSGGKYVAGEGNIFDQDIQLCGEEQRITVSLGPPGKFALTLSGTDDEIWKVHGRLRNRLTVERVKE